MTNVDEHPGLEAGTQQCDGPRSMLLDWRDVPLGGLRAMEVRRSLPQRELPMVGAWCFLDRFGPQDAIMRVEPHPHIGLQTVTWPFVGRVRHRDTLGNDVEVSRGVLNIMTAGNGIAHSEYSVGDGPVPLDALQLWVALPESRRHGAPDFERHADLPSVTLPATTGDDAQATVVLGSYAGADSPASVFTPIVGAEVAVPAGSTIALPLEHAFEHGIVLVEGDVTVHSADEPVSMSRDQLLYLGVHRTEVAVTSATGATLFLIGGEPFEDDIVMWWNFVGRDEDEILRARQDWEDDTARFGTVVGHGSGNDYVRIPAPPTPPFRITPRRRTV